MAPTNGSGDKRRLEEGAESFSKKSKTSKEEEDESQPQGETGQGSEEERGSQQQGGIGEESTAEESDPTQQDGTGFDLRPRSDLGEGPKVRLRPQIVVEDGKIARVLFGRQRTPSPFGGGRMGDHTVAWQALVDSVHALVHGLTVEQAIARVEARQKEVQAWMESKDRNVIGRRVFRLLDDRSARKPLLEDAAGRVGKLIGDAKEAWVKEQSTTPPPDEGEHAQPMPVEQDDQESIKELISDAEKLDENAILETVESTLDTAEKAAPPARAVDLLAQAIAYHLAYLNYLPFATVPARSARGSKTSGEATLRSVLIGIEKYADPAKGLSAEEFAPPPEDESAQVVEGASEGSSTAPSSGREPSPPSGTSVRHGIDLDAVRDSVKEALWGLFAFDAAIREAEVELFVLPGELERQKNECKKLDDQAKNLLKQFPQYLHRPPRTMRKGRPEVPEKPAPIISAEDRQEALDKIVKEISPIAQEKSNYSVVAALSQLLLEVVRWLRIGVSDPDNLFTADYRKLVDYEKGIASRRIELCGLTQELTAKAETGLQDAADILAYLLRDHQETVARAYPRSVMVTEFLGKQTEGDPAKAATDRLILEIARGDLQGRDLNAEVIARLKRQVEKAYRESGGDPKPAKTNRWAQSSKVPDVVASFGEDGELTITGRAPAPLGVEGMGSHTTMWAAELVALQWIVASAAPEEQARIQAIKGRVKDDLKGEVLELDYLLPADQLRSGQLHAVFDAAVRTLEAQRIESAAENYLRFRNLLPYATVDAGDRGGHGERKTRAVEKGFDRESLLQAVAQKADEYSQERVESTIDALKEAAAALEKEPGSGWTSTEEVLDAVVLSIGRLEEEAEALGGGKMQAVGRVRKIVSVRLKEHLKVCSEVTKYHKYAASKKSKKQ
ncbi:hypothetical protein LUW76_29245 [Actinomadura madurae]|uniref:hypothetical protein n=1 Tax=Actinomadura madurae TaxID=1993 RepID=UPI002026D4C4|nr:hypothetical protein [Actinomadura madurae]URM98121.1 hypothetical protein LUW76_29245 [Actinomadura madurae]